MRTNQIAVRSEPPPATVNELDRLLGSLSWHRIRKAEPQNYDTQEMNKKKTVHWGWSRVQPCRRCKSPAP